MTMTFEFESGRFFKNDRQGRLLAEVAWQPLPETKVWVIEHTYVSPAWRHQGIAKQLIAAVVQKARHDHCQIMPLCPYAQHEFKHRPDYADVYKQNNVKEEVKHGC